MEPTAQTPEEIRQALATDGQLALAGYFESFRARLAKIVSFRLDHRLGGRVSTSDVLQEAYVRAAKRLDHFLSNDDMPLFVWLRMEVQQQLVDLHRMHLAAEKRDVRKERVRLGFADASGTSRAMAWELSAQITSPSQWLRRAERLAWLETTLNEMNELDREVIALRHFEELSNDEAAQVLQISSAAASTRYLRALKRLREISHATSLGESVQ